MISKWFKNGGSGVVIIETYAPMYIIQVVMLEKLLPFIQYGHSIASIHELWILIITLKFVDKNTIRTWKFFKPRAIYRETTVQPGANVRFHRRWNRIYKKEFDGYFNKYDD